MSDDHDRTRRIARVSTTMPIQLRPGPTKHYRTKGRWWLVIALALVLAATAAIVYLIRPTIIFLDGVNTSHCRAAVFGASKCPQHWVASLSVGTLVAAAVAALALGLAVLCCRAYQVRVTSWEIRWLKGLKHWSYGLMIAAGCLLLLALVYQLAVTVVLGQR